MTPIFHRFRCDKRAFTLLELLVSISALVLVVVIIGAAMRLGYRSTDAGEKRIEWTERLRRSVEIMEAQIQSSMPLADTENKEELKSYFKGEKKTLTVATNYSIWDGRKGYLVADYRVETAPSGKETLLASERIIGTTATAETVLLKDYDLIEFNYLEKGLTTEETKWVEQWTREETVPDRVRLHLRFRGWDYSFVIPTRVRGNA